MTSRLLVVVAAAALAASCGGNDDRPDAAAFCARLDQLATNDPFAVLGQQARAPEVRSAFLALEERARELVDLAPDEIRPTAEEYAGAVDELESLLAGVAYDGARVDTTAYRAAQARYLDAADGLLGHFERSC